MNILEKLLSLIVSRTYLEKGEFIKIIGIKGVLELTKYSLKIFNNNVNLKEEYEYDKNENLR